MRLHPSLVLALLGFSFFQACGPTQSGDSALGSSAQSDGSFAQYIEAKAPKYDYDVNKLYAALKPHVQKTGNGYTQIAWVTQNAQGQRFFAALQLPKGGAQNGQQNGGGKVGLLDENLELILPVKYESIANFDLTVANFLELALGSQYGLFQPLTKQLIEPQFEAIYPYPNDPKRVLAQVKKGGKFGWLNLEGQANFEPGSHPDARLFQSPFTSELAQQWTYTPQPSGALPWVGSVDKEVLEHEAWGAIVLVPSFLQDFELGETDYSTYFNEGPGSIDEAALDIQKPQAAAEGWMATLASFFVSGVEARGFHNQQNMVIATKGSVTKANHISQKTGLVCSLPEGRSFIRVLDQGLIEVYQLSGLAAYRDASTYEYYRLNGEGQAEPVLPERQFPSASLVKMDESYFKGCFASLIEAEEEGEYMGQPMWKMDYLSLEDLDLMRNEVFAEHGLRFKTDKWAKYFAKQSWYKPRFDNVDDKLSDIEKQNIQLILDMKAKMEKDKRYQKKEKVHYVAAG